MSPDDELRRGELERIHAAGTRLLSELDAVDGVLIPASYLSMALDLLEVEMARMRGSIPVGQVDVTPQ